MRPPRRASIGTTGRRSSRLRLRHSNSTPIAVVRDVCRSEPRCDPLCKRFRCGSCVTGLALNGCRRWKRLQPQRAA
ncbi:hypothetical protein DVS28_a2727 [Euzebya pacifica]|uniref:Uncharacterized protein n=1 Tax=Euzebya pacifica TaxID=1608957 RepID=A0A346XYV9_9ACTN|nr:hypothetical protein DVS28_a2727 [Euzebya pacifica]